MHYPLITRVGFGQKAHRFLTQDSTKPCVIAGIIFDDVPGLASESDGDVVFHAIISALSTLTGIDIIAAIMTDLLEKDGITDSSVYLQEALSLLLPQKICHIAISLMGKKPLFAAKFTVMREKIAHIMRLELSQVGITATAGDGLTDYGCGDGLHCTAVITTVEEIQ